MDNNEILDQDLNWQPTANHRRRDMLPVWVKIFTWIFMLFGMGVPVALFSILSDAKISLALYGLETNDPSSLVGLLLIGLISCKSVTAYALWTEQDWAIKLAKIDAAIGFFFCILSLFGLDSIILGNSDSIHFSFRLELLALIPYWRFLTRVQSEWEDLRK